MKSDPAPAVRNIQSLYLSPKFADVWFRISDERVPGHKLILSAMSPYYETMFYGSLPENGEVNMTKAIKSTESFKEFLKFMYLREPHLTMTNIEDVISLSKQSLSNDFVSACEVFLKESLTSDPDKIFRIYHLALLYDIDHLKAMCEEDICVFAENVFKSNSFLTYPHEYLQMVLQRDDLAGEEIDIFHACMAWAKAACKENNLDPSNGKYLRDQLKEVVYQIRFTSMTKEEAGKCIALYPGLFTADELEEIICMGAQQGNFQPKQFNSTPRYFNLNWYKGRCIQFSRVENFNDCKAQIVNACETTRFSCNRRVLLHGFACYFYPLIDTEIRVTIKEINKENEIDRYNEQLVPHFNLYENQAKIVLNKSIILRPNYQYDICVKFESSYLPNKVINCRQLATKKRIDHDIVFRFEKHGIVSGFSIYRCDNKNYFNKVICNPKAWMVVVGGCIVGCLILKYICIKPSVSQPDVLPQYWYNGFLPN